MSGTSRPTRGFASSSAGAGGQGRLKRCPTTIPSSGSALSPAFNARVVRLMGTELMTVRIDLDPE